jgi:hypothetical protein
LLRLHRGTSRKNWITAAFRSEAGQGHTRGAATNVHSGHCWRAKSSAARATRAGRGRDTAAGVQIGSVASSGLARACTFSSQTAARAFAANQTFASAGAAKSRVIAARGRHGERSLGAVARYSHTRAGLRRDHNSGSVTIATCAFGRRE